MEAFFNGSFPCEDHHWWQLSTAGSTHQYDNEAGFLVTSCADGYAAGAILFDCTIHGDVKREWQLVHNDDVVITNLVVVNLLLDKGTE